MLRKQCTQREFLTDQSSSLSHAQWCKWRKRTVLSEAVMYRDKSLGRVSWLRWSSSSYSYLTSLFIPDCTGGSDRFGEAFGISMCSFLNVTHASCSWNLSHRARWFVLLCLVKWWWSVRYFLPAHAFSCTRHAATSPLCVLNRTNEPVLFLSSGVVAYVSSCPLFVFKHLLVPILLLLVQYICSWACNAAVMSPHRGRRQSECVSFGWPDTVPVTEECGCHGEEETIRFYVKCGPRSDSCVLVRPVNFSGRPFRVKMTYWFETVMWFHHCWEHQQKKIWPACRE